MAKRVLVLPTGAAVDGSSIQSISQIIRLTVSHGREIREMLHKLPSSSIQPPEPLPQPTLVKELEVVP